MELWKSNQLDLIGNFDAEIKFTDYLKFVSTNSVTYKTMMICLM